MSVPNKHEGLEYDGEVGSINTKFIKGEFYEVKRTPQEQIHTKRDEVNDRKISSYVAGKFIHTKEICWHNHPYQICRIKNHDKGMC